MVILPEILLAKITILIAIKSKPVSLFQLFLDSLISSSIVHNQSYDQMIKWSSRTRVADLK